MAGGQIQAGGLVVLRSVPARAPGPVRTAGRGVAGRAGRRCPAVAPMAAIRAARRRRRRPRIRSALAAAVEPAPVLARSGCGRRRRRRGGGTRTVADAGELVVPILPLCVGPHVTVVVVVVDVDA